MTTKSQLNVGNFQTESFRITQYIKAEIEADIEILQTALDEGIIKQLEACAYLDQRMQGRKQLILRLQDAVMEERLSQHRRRK